MDTPWICPTCGYVAFTRPERDCPVCATPAKDFEAKPGAIKTAGEPGGDEHVPMITLAEECGVHGGACRDVGVQIGSKVHPMEPEHAVVWMDAYLDGRFLCRYHMEPASLLPAVTMHAKTNQRGEITVVAFCNQHGHWLAASALG